MTCRLKHLLAVAILSAAGLFAADETFTLNATPKVIPFTRTEPSSLSQSDAQTIVNQVLGPVSDPDFYCIIHVVRWKDNEMSIQSSAWYLYHAGESVLGGAGRWTAARFRGMRIFGSDNLGIIYVHLNVPGAVDSEDMRRELTEEVRQIEKTNLMSNVRAEATASGTPVDEFVTNLYANYLAGTGQDRTAALASIDAQYKAAPTPAAKAGLLDAWIATIAETRLSGLDVAARVGRILAGSPEAVDAVYNPSGVRLKRVEGGFAGEEYIRVVYKVDVTKKLPAPVQNLRDALSVLQSEGARNITLTRAAKPVAIAAGMRFEIVSLPSDITCSGTLNRTDLTKLDLGTRTFDNEGLYHWDISLGIPLNSIKQLDFTAQNGQVTPKQVDKQNLFALLNIFPKPVDTKSVQLQLVPHPILGIALTKRPLDKILLGGAIGVSQLQVFAGVLFNRVQQPQTLAAGAPATETALSQDLERVYDRKFQVGLNLPVRQVLDFLKKK